MVLITALLTALSVGQALGTIGDGPIAWADTSTAVTQNGNAFTAVALNSLQTTDGIKTKGFRWVEWTLQYTFAAASAVTMACDQSEDGTTWAAIPYLTFSGSTAASQTMTWSEAVSASGNWVWTVPNHGVYMRCKFQGTGASSSDKLTLNARAGV